MYTDLPANAFLLYLALGIAFDRHLAAKIIKCMEIIFMYLFFSLALMMSKSSSEHDQSYVSCCLVTHGQRNDTVSEKTVKTTRTLFN